MTENEIQFLIDICNEKRDESGHWSKDIKTKNTLTHESNIHFIIQKLEKQLDR